MWNVEYRRLGLGGGYPATLADAATAIDYLATLEDVDIEPVVAIGHSAGGHLAAWAAGPSKLSTGAPGAGPVVEIAGVISLAFTESVTYVEVATAAGQDAQLVEVDGGHFSIADVSSSAWPTVVKALQELMGGVSSRSSPVQ